MATGSGAEGTVLTIPLPPRPRHVGAAKELVPPEPHADEAQEGGLGAKIGAVTVVQRTSCDLRRGGVALGATAWLRTTGRCGLRAARARRKGALPGRGERTRRGASGGAEGP